MGSLKGKFLKSNLKLDFIYDQASLKIDNLFFRDKSLSLDSDGLVILKPFLEINPNFICPLTKKTLVNILQESLDDSQMHLYTLNS